MAGDLTLRLRITGDASSLQATVVDAAAAVEKIGPAASSGARQAKTALDTIEAGAHEAGRALEQLGPAAADGARGAGTALDSVQAGARETSAAAKGAASDIGHLGTSLQMSLTHTLPLFDQMAQQARGIVPASAAAQSAIQGTGQATVQAAAQVAGAADRQRRGAAQAAEATGNLGRQTGITAQQMAQLTPQINDVVTSLAMGMSPLMVLTQQGTQITQVFGGPIATLRAMAGALGVVGIAAIGAGTALAVVGGHAIGLERQQRLLQVALLGTGRAAVVSTGQLQEYVRTLQRAGAEDAEGIVARLARTRGLSGGDIGRVVGLAPDLAAALGTGTAEAADQLVAAMTRGYDAVAKLDNALGALTTEERARIRSLLEQGERTQAVALLTARLTERLGGLARQALSPTAQATRELSSAWNNFMDAVAKSEPVITMIRQLAGATGQIADYIRNGGGLAPRAGMGADEAAGYQGVTRTGLQERIDSFRRQADQVRGRAAADGPNSDAGRRLAGLEARIAEVQGQYDRLFGGSTSREAGASVPPVARGLPDSAPGPAPLDVDPADVARQRTAVDDLTQSWRDQQRILAVGITQRDAMRARVQAEREAAEQNIRGAQRDEFIRRRVEEVTRGQAAAAAEHVVALNAETAAAVAAAEAATQGRAAMMRVAALADARAAADSTPGTDVVALAQARLNSQAAQIARDAAGQLPQLTEAADSAERIAAALSDGFRAGRVVEVEEQVRTLTAELRAAAEASDDPRLKRLLGQLAGTLGGQVRRGAAAQDARQLQEMLAGQRQDMEMLRLQSQLLGGWGSNVEDAEKLADLRAVHELERARLPVVGALAEEYRAQARAIAGMTLQVQRQQAAWDEVAGIAREAMTGAGQAIQRDIQEGVLGFKTLEKVGLSVANTLTNKFMELAIINPILNMLTGGSRLPVLGDIFSTLGGVAGAGAAPAPAAGGILLGATYHTGGIVSAGAASRALPASLFAQAPRLHTGGFIGHGEVPAILRAGEGVFTPEQMAAMGGPQVSVSIAFAGDAGAPADRRRLQAMVADAVDQGIARRLPAIAAASNASLVGNVRRGGDLARTLGRG
jgi:hypothetical protein